MKSSQLQDLIQDVRVRTGPSPSDYTKGYLDCLVYLLEILEEEEEEYE